MHYKAKSSGNYDVRNWCDKLTLTAGPDTAHPGLHGDSALLTRLYRHFAGIEYNEHVEALMTEPLVVIDLAPAVKSILNKDERDASTWVQVHEYEE